MLKNNNMKNCFVFLITKGINTKKSPLKLVCKSNLYKVDNIYDD